MDLGCNSLSAVQVRSVCDRESALYSPRSTVFSVSFLLAQVFLHRLDQYAATKMDKNVTEETVKVRVWGLTRTQLRSEDYGLLLHLAYSA